MFTIHNIEYQGKFGANTVSDLFGLDRGWYDGGTLEMDGCVNLMKGAMLCADAVTTVSPTYARGSSASAPMPRGWSPWCSAAGRNSAAL